MCVLYYQLLTKNKNYAASHVLATMISNAFNYRDGTTVSYGKTLASNTSHISSSRRGPIKTYIAGDYVQVRFKRWGFWWINNYGSSRKTFTYKVLKSVFLTQENYLLTYQRSHWHHPLEWRKRLSPKMHRSFVQLIQSILYLFVYRRVILLRCIYWNEASTKWSITYLTSKFFKYFIMMRVEPIQNNFISTFTTPRPRWKEYKVW